MAADLAYLAMDLMYLQHQAEMQERRVERRAWREEHNPFELNDDVFIDLFRLSPDLAMEVVEELEPMLEKHRPTGISVEHQVCVPSGSIEKLTSASYSVNYDFFLLPTGSRSFMILCHRMLSGSGGWSI